MTENPQPLPEYGVPPQLPAEPAEQPKLGTVQRLTAVFFSPGELFADINRKPDFIVPLIVAIVMILGFSQLAIWKVNFDSKEVGRRAIERSLEKQGKSMRDLPEQQRAAMDQQLEFVSKYQKAIGIAGIVVGFPLFYLVLTMIFHLGTLLVRGQAAFQKVLSVTVYSSMAVDVVKSAFSTLVVFLKPPDIDAWIDQSFIATNLGVLAPNDLPVAASVLLRQFDVFTIWFLILMTLGLAAVSYKKRPAGMAVVTVGLWVVWVLARVGWAAIFKS